MENNESKFSEILEDIKYRARLQGGYISKEDVEASFESMDLSKEQFELVFDYLKNNHIGIDNPLDEEEYISQGEINVLKEYENDLAGLVPLTDGELRAYTMAAMNNEADSYDKLIGHYLPKVIDIAKLYSSYGVGVEDLIGEGNLALAEGVKMAGAMENIDEVEGMLVKLIMDAMERLINETEEEKTKDLKMADKANAVLDKAKTLYEELGRKLTVEELSELGNISEKRIMEAIRLSSNNIEYIEYQEDMNV